MSSKRCVSFAWVAAVGLIGCVAEDGQDDVRFDEEAAPGEEAATDVGRRRDPTAVPVMNPDVAIDVAVAGGCMLYKDPNYGGASMWIPYGWDYNDLHRVNGFGDNISSLQCDQFSGATVWNGSNFTGVSLYVTGDWPTLPMNNSISSLSWGDNFGGLCTFFADANYGGNALNIYAGVDYNDTHRASPAMGDNIGSIFCNPGTVPLPTVCKSDTWGNCMTLVGNAYPSLSGVGYNDNISSIRW